MAKTKVKVIVALFAVIALSLLAVCFGRLFSPAEAKAADGTYDDTAAVALMQDLIIDGQATLTENVVFDLTQQSDILGSQLPDGLLRFPATYSHKNVTIDLGGRTLEIITGSDKCCLHVADGITVTVKNGTLKGSSAGSFAWGETGSKIVLEDVDIKFETSSTETGAAGDEGTTPGGSSEDHVILSNGSVELSGVTFDTNVSDPVAVFTKDAETGEFVGTDVTYGTLQDAINATGYNECIQVSDKIKSVNAEEKSVTESIVIPEGQKINLDLNGYTLKNVKEAGKYAAITNNGELYVYNGIIAATSAAKMSSSNDDDYIPYGIYNYGKLTANNVTITSYSTGSGTAVEDPDKPTSSVSVGAYGIYSKGSSVNLRNIIVTSNSASTTSSAVYNNSGILAIYGGEYTGKTYAVYSGTTNESVTINGGTYKADTGTGSGTGIYTNTSTTVTITGVTVNAVGTGVRIGGNESAMISDSTITVNNSKNNSKSYALNIVSAGLTVDSVKLEANASAGNGYGIYTSELKTLTIKGDSSIKASSKAGFNVYAMEIKGDETSVVNIESCDIQSGKLDIYSGATVNISGGTFGDLIYKEGSKFVITGGTFATVPNLDLLADDYAIYKEDGKYVVKADDGNATLSKNDSVMIGDTGYDTLTEALSDVKDGDTVTLLKNVAGDVEIASGVITLDLNGNTLDGNIAVSAGTLNVIGNGNVTGTVGKTGGTLAVSGGSYTNVIAADCIAEGYVLEAQRYDGALTVEVVAGTATASMTIGDDTTEYKFDTIASAIAAAPYEDKATVKLLSDITLGDDDHMTISVSGKEVVLDLNENTLEATSEFNVGTNSFIYISDGANFTIQNGKIVRNITSDSAIALIEVAGGISEDTRATLNLGSDLTIEQNGNLAIFIRRYATLNSAANISVTGGGVIESNGSADNYYSGYTIINITGGNLTSDGVAIFHPQKGELNITGGTITGATGIVLRGGELNISGDAVVKATGEKKTPEELFATRPDGGTDGALNTGDAVLIYNAGYPAEEMMKDSSITGGKFESENGSAVSSLTHTYNTSTKYEQVNNFISGGEFDGMPESDYIAAGADLYMNADKSGFAVATESAPEGYKKVVATIGDTAYTSLAEAVTAAGENATIVLYADVTESVTIAADDVITLNLNGKTITNTAGQHTITNNGTLTIVGNGTVNNVSHGRAALLNNPNATMTVLGGTYRRTAENAGNNSFYVIQNKGTMTIGGTGASDIVVYAGATTEGSLALRKSSLVTSGWYSDAPDGGAASLTINSGSFYGGNIAIKCDEKTSLTINGGVFNAYNQAVQSWTNTKITNGTFNGIVAAWTLVDNTTGDMIETPSALDITGGTFNGAIVANRYVYLPDDEYATEVNDNADVDISGGTFTKAFDSDFLADNVNLYQTETGFAAATEQNAPADSTKVVAFVRDKAYGSIQAAIDAADGAIVTLYDDVTLSETIVTTENVTIDFAGKTIATSVKAITATNGAVVTLSDGTITYTGSDETITGLVAETGAKLVLNKMTVSFPDGNVAIRLGDGNGGDGGMLELTDSTVYGGAAGVGLFGSNNAEAPSSMTAKNSKIYYTKSFGISTNGSFANNAITLENTDILMNGDVPTGAGIYLAGAGTTDITGGTIEGATGIEIRAGKLTINEGTIVKADGDYAVEPNGNGSTVVGVAIAVSQHTTERPIEVTVNGGEFSATGTDGKAFYETDTVTGETEPSEDVTITIDGGNFTAPVESKNKTEFVSGGNFSEVLDSAYLGENVNMYVSEGKYTAATAENAPENAELVVAVIGTKGYTSLNAAIADVKAGAASQFSEETTVITLMTDTKDSSDIGTSNGQAPKNVTIDLNGHTLTLGPGVESAGTETAGLRVLAYSTLTVKNGTLKCSDDTADHIWVGIANYGKTTLENVTLDAAEVTQYPVNNRGELTLKGDTTVENGGVYDIAITNDPYNYYYKDVDASLNIADPEVTVGTVRLELYGNATNNGVPVLNVSAGTLQTIITDGSNAIGFESNVSGATFEELPDAGLIGDSDMYQTADGKFKASDSTVDGATKVIAMVGDKAYDDLNEAIANANGQTVELYKDVENITVASDSDVTIDLNGNSAGKITVNAPTTKAAGGTVKFTDGYASSLVANGSSVALEKVAFDGTGKGNAITLHEGATVAMNGGSISSYDIGIYVGKRGEAVSSLTVTGVEFSDIPSKGIYGEAIGDLSVKNNTFGTTGTGSDSEVPEIARSSAAIDINQTMAGGNVTISGNKFNNCGTEDGSTSGAVKIKVRNIPVEQAAGQAGDFEEGATYVGSFESITVERNTYTDCVRDIVLGTGYVAETVPSSDVLTITEADTVKVTDFGRVDDEEALKGALADKDLTVIKLAGDVELTEAVAVARAVTIDINGYDITGNINVTAADVTITAPETSDSAINGIVTVTNADDFTLSNVTVNYTVTGEEEADSLKIMGAVVIDGSENATIDNVTVNVTANNSGLNVVSVWVKNDSTATISDSTIDLEFRATEENRTQGQVVRAETSDLTIKDSVITTTDYGVIFYGDMSATDAQADNTAAFDKLVIENSTVTVTDTDKIVGAYAVSGNGSNRNGTIIEITGSTITSDVATAIYHPQYGNMTITDSVITGASGIEMRSGNLTVTSGTITATGAFEVEPNGNGNTASGVAVAVSQHTTEMKINVQLNGGTFNATGENGKAFYETDTVTGVDPSADVTVDLNGGTYEAAVEAKNIKNFINDGLYKVEPKEDAFAEGYEGVLYNGYYQVVEATTDDPAALLTAKTEAQADVRSYLGTMLGMTIADVNALAADETLGAAAQAVIDAYAAMDGATSESKLAIARLSVMDAIDALDKALDTALADYKAAAIEKINSYGAEKDVAVPTATIMAINSAKTEAEVDMYKEYAIGEIDDIVAYREAISNIEIPDYSDTLDALSDKLDTLTGNLTSVSNTLGEKIDAVKTDIATVTADIDKLETTLAGLADSDDVNGIAEDISDIIEQLAAIKSTVDGISVAVDEATAVEEVKTEAAAEIDAWLEDYIDSIVESSATSVRDILTAKAAMADDLRSKLVDAFGEDNAALIEKYYDDAMAAIENATSASEATNAVSTFKAQVASVEAAAGNTTSLAGVYVLLAIILVVAIVAVVLAVVLKRKGGEPAPATAQPAPEAAPAPAPAAETAPAPAATEEAPAAQPEDESAATATDEDTERVVITASTRTFEEAYEALDPELRDLFDKVKAYALSKNGTTEVKLSNCICIKYGSKKVVRLTVRRSYPLAMFVIENEMVKDFRRNATGALKLKVPATELVIRDEEDLKAAYSMVDLAVDQILKDIEAAKERRRAARRARRAQREAEAGEAGETSEASEAPDDGGKK